MFDKKEKIAIVIGGLEILGFGALAICAYGKAKFCEGRTSKGKELKPIIKAFESEYNIKKGEA